MRTYALLVTLFAAGILSCQRTNTPPVTPPRDTTAVTPVQPGQSVPIDASKITGWWGAYYKDPSNPLEYNRLYFGPDSFYLQGIYTGRWDGSWWLTGDTIHIDMGGVASSKVSIAYSPDTLLIFQAGTTRVSYVRIDSSLITSAPIRIVAGDPNAINYGDGAPAIKAKFYYPLSLVMDAAENIYLSDDFTVIRKISASDGTITRYAGNYNTYGYSGEGGAALDASINTFGKMALDSKGNLYLTDNTLHALRKIAADGTIRTIAGNSGPYSQYGGDGGLAVNATFSSLDGLTVDGSDNIYILDSARVRKIAAADGTIDRVAGTGVRSTTGDDGPAVLATLNASGITADQEGNIYIADRNTIRKIDAATGIIHRIAGNGVTAYGGEGVVATQAPLNGVGALLVNPAGDMIFAEADYRIRRINGADGKLFTIVGAGERGNSGDSRHATACAIGSAGAIVQNKAGEIFFTDFDNNVIRKIMAR